MPRAAAASATYEPIPDTTQTTVLRGGGDIVGIILPFLFNISYNIYKTLDAEKWDLGRTKHRSCLFFVATWQVPYNS